MLGIWPALPIAVWADVRHVGPLLSQFESPDNVIAALLPNNRVCEISLQGVTNSLLESLASVTQEQFPALTSLDITSWDETTVIPDTFLGAFTPRLRSFILRGVAFPAIRKLLLSANHLVELILWNIPHSGYISPETMVTCLSSLPNLKSLDLEFRSPRSLPDRANRRLPPPTRITLPALTSFWFRGVSEYAEDFVSQIDAPLLAFVDIIFFHQLVFDTPQLYHFIARTEKFRAHNRAAVMFYEHAAYFKLEPGSFLLGISCTESHWQLSSVEQLCRSSLPRISTLERLDIREAGSPGRHWQDDMEIVQWLELLQLFPAVKELYLDQELALRVVPAMQELVEQRGIEVLPALQDIFIEGLRPLDPIHETIGNFVAARQLSRHAVVVHSRYRV